MVQTASLVIAGLAVGMVLALLLESAPYGVSAADPITLGLTALVLGVASLAGQLIAGHSCTRFIPITALRSQ